MSMRIGKALVVDGEDKTRAAANHLLLSSAGQPFDYAASLVEAVEFLKHNNYVCIFAASELPAIAGAPARRQDLENLLDKIDRLKGQFKPPVVCLYSRMADMDDDDWTCWSTDMALRGVVKWVKKPFPSSGRTPDRMLKKILSGQYVRVVKAPPLTAAELMAAPLQNDARDVAGCKQADAPTLVAGEVPALDDVAIAAKLKKVLGGSGVGKDGMFAGLSRDSLAKAEPCAEPVHVAEPAVHSKPDPARAGSPSDNRCKDVHNEPISLDDFMAKFCQARGKENRLCRKRALLAAARHGTVELPPLAGGHKHGMPNHYLVHDLLVTWQRFLDEGVDLPPLKPEFAAKVNHSNPGDMPLQ